VVLGVAVLVALATLLAARRSAPTIVAPPASHAQPSIEATAAGAPGGLFVHVAGAVEKPGLYELGPGARVADAIALAGGELPKADLDLVNLAEPLVDGMKIEVPRRGAAVATSSGLAESSGAALVSINSAGLEELETLPGVGPVTAQAIVSHREEVGAFAALEDLLDVSGIGPATFAEIRPHVTL
jgi:competence protein ComEA